MPDGRKYRSRCEIRPSLRRCFVLRAAGSHGKLAPMAILDHVGIRVRDYQKSKAFYEKALEPLGIRPLKDFGVAVGFGRDGKPDFWLGADHGGGAQPMTPVHVAFAARNREEVDAFHAAALAAGGRDNGAPGIRAQYHPGYYGAFVLDPDGHNVEVVHHTF